MVSPVESFFNKQPAVAEELDLFTITEAELAVTAAELELSTVAVAELLPAAAAELELGTVAAAELLPAAAAELELVTVAAAELLPAAAAELDVLLESHAANIIVEVRIAKPNTFFIIFTLSRYKFIATVAYFSPHKLATACAAMPSPRPVKPSFSVVVPLIPT